MEEGRGGRRMGRRKEENQRKEGWRTGGGEEKTENLISEGWRTTKRKVRRGRDDGGRRMGGRRAAG